MDIQILIRYQKFREATGGYLNNVFAFITTVAVDYYILVPALILFWAVDKRAGLYSLGSWGTSVLENAGLKATFCVYRPWIRSSEIHPLPEVIGGATGYSFPSGHASSASGFYGALIAYYRRHKALCVLFVCMVLLTMISRNYVGVHTPQDVIVGCLSGAAATAIVVLIDRFLQKRPSLDWVIALAATAVCAGVLVYVACKSYPVDYDADGKILVDPNKMTVDSFKDPGRFFGIVWG